MVPFLNKNAQHVNCHSSSHSGTIIKIFAVLWIDNLPCFHGCAGVIIKHGCINHHSYIWQRKRYFKIIQLSRCSVEKRWEYGPFGWYAQR